MRIALIAIIVVFIIVIAAAAAIGCTGGFDKEATPTPTRTPTPVSLSYTLREALDQGLIEVEIEGISGLSMGGVSSGDVIKIGLLRRLQEEMEILVPMGTTLISTDPSKQNMVILKLKGHSPSVLGYYPASKIILDKDEWRYFLFEAYCLDIQKGNIFNTTTFIIGEMASLQVLAVLDAAQRVDSAIATNAAIQVAIWVHTEDPTREELLERFNANDQDINNAWTILDRANLVPDQRKLFGGTG